MSVTADEFFAKNSGTVTLCGSTKFFFEVMEANRLLTFQEWIVLMCGSWGHSYHKYAQIAERDYPKVKRLHYQKILNSDAVVVVSDSSKYIGDSTRAEIKFAEHIKIPVFYFDGKEFTGTTNQPVRFDNSFDYSLIDEYEKHHSLGF